MEKKKIFLCIISLILLIVGGVFVRSSLSIGSLQDEVTLITKNRINEIKSTKNTDISNRTGRVFYVSLSGDDSNDGLSTNTPIKTITRLNKMFTSKDSTGKYLISDGDTVLFKRGEEFRGHITIPRNDITLGSYGDESKPKPIINGSPYDGAKEGTWEEVYPNFWVYKFNDTDQVFKKDVGEIWFFCNKGNNNCDRTSTIGDLKYRIAQKIMSYDNEEETPENIGWRFQKDLDFYHMGHSANNNSNVAGAIYVYSKGNPADRFDKIEFNLGGNVIGTSNSTNLVVDNLDIRHAGKHAVGTGTTANLTVQNCEIYFTGGMVQKYDKDGHWPVRLGNAIEVYGSITAKNGYDVAGGLVAKNNYIYESYDAGLTFQYTAPATGSSPVERVEFDNNVVEYASYNIEYWNDVTVPEEGITSEWYSHLDQTYLNKIYFTNNILRFAGMGFTETRPEHGYEALIKGWDGANNTSHNKIKDGGEFLIENNIFDTTGVLKDNTQTDVGIWMLHITAGYEESLPVIKNNKFYNYNSRNLGHISSSEAINWSKKLIPYSTELNYDTNLLKDNEFYSYDETQKPTGIKSGKSGATDWILNLNKHTLTISGNGDMADYTLDSLPEWNSYADYIHTIVIEENVTKIGDYAFYNLVNVNNLIINAKNLKGLTNSSNNALTDLGVKTTGVTLEFGEEVTVIPAYLTRSNGSYNSAAFIKHIIFKGNKIKKIEKYALNFLRVTDLILPDSIETIEEGALYSSRILKVLVVPDNVTTLPKYFVRSSPKLETIIMGANTTNIGVEALYELPKLECIVIQSENFVFDENNQILNKMNTLYKFRLYGPSNLKTYVDAFNENAGYQVIQFIDLINYRPIIYGDRKNYYALFDEAYINENTTFELKTISKASVTLNGAKYRYVDSQGATHLMDGVKLNGNTISNIKMDVQVDASVSDTIRETIDSQNVVFFGNSILRGFGSHGMASTTINDDYYHYIMSYLTNMNPEINPIKYGANTWEGYTTSDARNAETENFINYIKSNKNEKKVGTIFLEFGDNVNNDEKRVTFKTDFIYMVNRLKEEFPNAKIYYFFGWYNYSQNISIVNEVVNETGIKFIDYYSIKTEAKKQFRGVTPGSFNRLTSYVGFKYIDSSNVRRLVDSDGVGTHPGDYGFIRISDIVLDYIKNDNTFTKSDSISSSSYVIENARIKVLPVNKEFTRSLLLNNITSSDKIRIYDKIDREILNDTRIGTGYKASASNLVYDIIVKGDTTGDGVINLGDVSKMYNYYKGKPSLEGIYLEAAKVTSGSTITFGDISKVYNYYKGNVSTLG